MVGVGCRTSLCRGANGTTNIFVENCRFGVQEEQWAVFNAKSNCDRGGVVENVFFRNLEVGNCRHLVRMETDYKNVHFDPVEHPYPPTFRDMAFENIKCAKTSRHAFYICGLEQKSIRNLMFRRIDIDEATDKKQIEYAENLEQNFACRAVNYIATATSFLRANTPLWNWFFHVLEELDGAHGQEPRYRVY